MTEHAMTGEFLMVSRDKVVHYHHPELCRKWGSKQPTEGLNYHSSRMERANDSAGWFPTYFFKVQPYFGIYWSQWLVYLTGLESCFQPPPDLENRSALCCWSLLGPVQWDDFDWEVHWCYTDWTDWWITYFHLVNLVLWFWRLTLTFNS